MSTRSIDPLRVTPKQSETNTESNIYQNSENSLHDDHSGEFEN